MQAGEYANLARVEDRMWYFRSLHAAVAWALRRSGEEERPQRVLDAGCGTGGLIRRLRPEFPHWSWQGLDVSPLACALARSRTGADITEGSVMALPYAEGAFDRIVLLDVISETPEPGRALAEVARCLRPGGLLVLHVAAYRWLWSYHDDLCATRHRFRRGQLVRECRSRGLAVRFSTYRGLPAFPFLVLRRKFWQPDPPVSDTRDYAPWLDRMCLGLARVEHRWLQAGVRSPWGSSVFVVAQKPVGGR